LQRDNPEGMSSAFPNRSKLQELPMSAINGDKSRFHRERKQKIAKRKRTRELLAIVNAQPESKARSASKSAKESSVSA